MGQPVRKPFIGQAPIVNETPAVDDWGQITRPILDVPIPIEGIPGGVPVEVTGTVVVTKPNPHIGTVVRIPVALVSVMLRAANAARRGLKIYNDARRPLLVRVAAGPCTAVDWTAKLYKDDILIVPDGGYDGNVTGMWLGADPAGGAQVTEWT